MAMAQPGRPVPVSPNKGGMFNTRTPQISKETQQLLQVMMKESKLTNFQQRQLSAKATSGQSLPVDCNPTSSKSRQQQTPSPKKPTKKILSGKDVSISGKRPKEVIDRMKAQNPPEKYKPPPGKMITQEDKDKFRKKMAYGDCNHPEPTSRKRVPRSDGPDEDTTDEFDEVLRQIDERKEFLQEMEALGEGKKYRQIINTEISQKIRELELIDKKRHAELADYEKEALKDAT